MQLRKKKIAIFRASREPSGSAAGPEPAAEPLGSLLRGKSGYVDSSALIAFKIPAGSRP